jgi:hypothetical protein
MKKLISFAVLMVMLTGAVFAQELRFSGYLNSGLGVVSDDDDNNVLKAFGVDSEQNGYRFRFNGSYRNEAGNAGVSFRFQSQSGLTRASFNSPLNGGTVDGTTATGNVSGNINTTAEFISFPYLFGWVGFLENKITLSGGIIEDTTWATGDYWLASDSVNDFVGLGALLKLTPVEGLVFGFGAHTVGRSGGGDNNTLSRNNFNHSLDLEDTRYVLHAVYTMKDVFRIGGSYRTESLVHPTATNAMNTSRAYGELRFLGVKDLTAIAAAAFYNIDDFDSTGEMIFSESFAYKIDNINIGLNAVQFMFNRAANNDASLLFNLWGSVGLADNSIVPRLDAVYFMGGSSTASASAMTWHRKGFAASGNNDVSLLSVRPSVRINLDNRTHLEIGDMINIDDFGGDNKLTNVFYIDFRWSF